MSQQRQYKRSEIIDDDEELRLLSSVIELAFAPNSKGWTVDGTYSSIQTKPDSNFPKRPIYRGIIKNQSSVTMKQIYQCYQAGYKRTNDIVYHIDDDHDILYSKNEPNALTSGRDDQYMSVRSRFTTLKFNIQYNIVAIIYYNILKTHPLYVDPPKKYIRRKQGGADIYYQRVGALDNDFVYVRIEFPFYVGGWIPNWVVDNDVHVRMKQILAGFPRFCQDIPGFLKSKEQMKRKPPVLMNDHSGKDDDRYRKQMNWLLRMSFEEDPETKSRPLNDDNIACNEQNDAIIDEHPNVMDTMKGNEIIRQKPVTGHNNDGKEDDLNALIDHPNVMDTDKGDIIRNAKKDDTQHDDEHRNTVDTNGKNMNEIKSIYDQLINMGFNHNESTKAAELSPNDVNEAIDIAANYEYETKQYDDDNKGRILPIESVKQQFRKFLRRLNLEQFYHNFAANNCSDMDSIECFDDDFLKNDIGIKNRIIRQRFLAKCKKMKDDMNEFKNEEGMNNVLYDRLSQYGIVTLSILCAEIKRKADLRYKYQITNDIQCDLLWNLIQKHQI